MIRNSVQAIGRIAVLSCVVGLGVFSALGQVPGPAGVPPAPNQGPAQILPPQQLDNLVAPVALYPDPLLGQVLAAATYPVELVEAQQFTLANQGMGGPQLMDAAKQQDWDPSVQALVAMPNVLSLLTQDIRWTTDLGNAFLAQQGDVMSAVQRMRQRAQANGQLRTTPQETVSMQDQGGQQAIEIQPADPQEIYVPSYDPYYVYGYGAYPSLYYPDGYWFEPGINVGLYFGGWGGWGIGGWGWGCNWFGGGLFVNTGFFNRYGFHYRNGFAGGFGSRTPWMHDPAHRMGAGYSNGQLNARFGAASQASRMAAGRSGNWHSFSGTNGGNANAFRGSGQQSGARGVQSFQGSSAQSGARGVQSFQGSSPQSGARGGQSFQGSSNNQRFEGGQNYRSQAPTQRYQAAPTQRFAGPAQQRAPAYSAPQRSFQSAPRTSAPGYGGGGGGHNYSSGGGGGVSHSSGGGGGASHSSGGGGHGGGRR